MAWSLRARGPSGQATLGGLDAGTSVADLQKMLEHQLGVPASRQELLAGFPPKPLEVCLCFVCGERRRAHEGGAQGSARSLRRRPPHEPPPTDF